MGTEWKSKVPSAHIKEGNEQKDVLLTSGLMEWSEKARTLKQKQGKTVVLGVLPTISYLPLKQEAEKHLVRALTSQ